MVSLGINVWTGIVYAYDEATKKQTRTKFKKIHPSEKNIVVYEKFFSDIKLKFGKIGNVCLELYAGNSNEMRKMLLQIAYAQGFSNVEMVGCPAAFFLRNVTQFNFDLQPGDIVWVQLDDTLHVFQNIKRRFQRVDFLSIHTWDKNFKTKPNYVILLPGYQRLWIKIETFFPNCSVKFFNQFRDNGNLTAVPVAPVGGLMKARISAGEERLQKYDCYPAVQDSIACFINNRKVLEIPAEQILPLKRVIPVQKEKGDTFLDICLDKYWERIFLPPENDFNLEFIVDINGIYSFKYLKYEPSNIILNPFNREWIKVPNVPETYTNSTGIYKYEENMDVVAIDLGMSKCCLAVGRTDGIKMVALGNTGSYLLPSYISFRQNEPICGEIAVKDLQNYTNFTVFDVKRIIGKEYSDVNVNGIWPFKVVDAGDEPVIRIERNGAPILFSPSQVSAVLLKYIKKIAEDYQGRSLKHAVITVPAAFTFSQKRDTLEAAKIAGWEKVDLLLEPIAAAFSYFHNKPISTKSTVLLFDLGGGTLDLSIFKISSTKLTTLINNGNVDLGGRDFDMVLYNYFFKRLKNEFGIDVLGQKKYRLLLECQEIKHSLSNNNTDGLDIGIFDVTKDGYLNVIRNQFENMSKELLSRIKDLVANTLIKAKYAPNDIDMVILAGGGCRMPMIREILKEMFPGSEIRSQNNVEEVVAFGAARYACNLLKDTSGDKCSIM